VSCEIFHCIYVDGKYNYSSFNKGDTEIKFCWIAKSSKFFWQKQEKGGIGDLFRMGLGYKCYGWVNCWVVAWNWGGED